MQDINLRGLVASRYGSATNLARRIGWKEKRARAVVNQGKEPSAKELEALAEALGVDNAEDFVRIFFPCASTKWTTKE